MGEDSCSQRRFPGHDGMLDFSGPGTLAGVSVIGRGEKVGGLLR